MHEDKNEDSAVNFWEKIQMWMMVQKVKRKTKANIRHGRLMMAFFEHLASKQEDQKKRGELGLKAGQLEASVDQEERFLIFIQQR